MDEQVEAQLSVSKWDAKLLEIDAKEACKLKEIEAWIQGKKVRLHLCLPDAAPCWVSG